MQGADAVVNCVGTFDRKGRNNFDAVQHEGAERIARLASEENVERMVHISAIGANAESDSIYAQTKAQGEAGILAAFPTAVILRPSVIFGPDDNFFNRFAGMTRFSPFLPVVGGNTKFQTVYVDDVAHAAAKGVMGEAEPGVYELGGPDVNTFRELMEQMLQVIRRRRIIINLPFWMANIMAAVMEFIQTISLGLVPPQITRDQVRSLKVDNVVADDAKGFADLEIEPTSLEAVLPDYLWRFRPAGQYEAIKESAGNLRPD